jgi:hypothetical protein
VTSTVGKRRRTAFEQALPPDGGGEEQPSRTGTYSAAGGKTQPMIPVSTLRKPRRASRVCRPSRGNLAFSHVSSVRRVC